MGVFVSVWKRLFGEDDKEFKILILGLDRAGKTTISERIQGKGEGEPVPTIGYNHKQVRMRNVTLDTWDLSGQERMRKIWKHYFVAAWGIIFVIDWTDLERLDTARDELHFLLAEPELKNIPVLILANKQDLPEALNCQKLKTELALSEEESRRPIKVQEASAILDKGLEEGFKWLVKKLSKEEDDSE
jgi:small GTP-binding protein